MYNTPYNITARNYTMVFLKPSSSTMKTFYYNFFPTKEEEERERKRSGDREANFGRPGGYGRMLIEMRDFYPPPVVDPSNPWVIKKTLNRNETDSGKLVLTCFDTFEHVFRYWPLSYANSAATGHRVGVAIRDVTPENYPRKFNEMDDGVYLEMGESDDFYLMCKPLMKDRNWQVYDEIGLYWSCDKFCFMVRLFLGET